MLAGQTTDAVMTPLIGVLSDKYESPKVGKRKFWYLIGFLIVALGFTLTFQPCLLCLWFSVTTISMQLSFHLIGPCMYNFGWAFCQVSHMSLGPSLTCSRSRRDRLSNLRNTFTYVSQLVVLIVALLYFTIFSDPLFQFEILSYTAVTIGLIACFFFIFTIDEKRLSKGFSI